MKELHSMKSGIHFLFVSAALVIIIAGINLANVVLTPLLISAFLALLSTPMVLWLQRRNVGVGISVGIVLVVIILALGSLSVIVANSAKDFLNDLPLYQTKLHEQVQVLVYILNSKGVAVNSQVVMGYLNTDLFSKVAGGFIGVVGTGISTLVVVLLTISFILLESASFPNKIRVAVGNPRAAFPEFTAFMYEIQRFVIFQTFIGLITGISIAIWLTVLGVDFAILLGLLTFLLCYIPNVGSAITLVPTVAVAFFQFGAGHAVLVAVGYLAITFVLGSIIQPRLIGKKLGLSTLVVFLSVILWGSLLGPIGLVLCVPLTMAMKFSLESNDNTRWIGILLERGPAPKKTRTRKPTVKDVVHES